MLDNPNRKWSTLLKEVVSQYNNTPHDITGFTPSYLLFGTEEVPSYGLPSVPLTEARELARTRTANLQQTRKQRHDNKHSHLKFDINSKVLWRVPSNFVDKVKTTPKWFGPFTVVKQIGEVTYDLLDPSDKQVFRAHTSQLKKFVDRQQIQMASAECN
jgi:hypothetical protein